MSRKGISPLIATVMLVAVVIVIAFLVFWWYGEYIEESLEKSEITAEQACLNDVSFSLSQPGCLENSTGPNEKIVYFNIENNGDIKINNFKANIDGNIGSTFVTIPQSVDQSVETKLSFIIDTSGVGTDLGVTLTPMVKAGGITRYCTDKTKAISVDCS
jgi:flagellin-like protein